MFISHTGRIHPSGFLPIDCGRFPDSDPVAVYQDAPVFRRLRDPDRFRGKCGVCEFRHICGGSRARAYAVTGDPLASEPDCVYNPRDRAAPSERP
jgi:radical SAM protein with 4Fe4S-binding SPASM domain